MLLFQENGNRVTKLMINFPMPVRKVVADERVKKIRKDGISERSGYLLC